VDGWDERVEAALATPGIAYGDDLIHGVRQAPRIAWWSQMSRATWFSEAV
jgi:hypothetical protein